MTPSHLPEASRILYSAEQIQKRVHELADEIVCDYGQQEFLTVSIMKGSFIFAADLIRSLSDRKAQPILDFITLSSYGSKTVSCGSVSMLNGLTFPVTGCRVLIIDDILDTGLTLQTASRLLYELGAKEVRTCVLLDKPARRSVPFKANYRGFQIEDVFIIGYGLDYENRYRHLPYLTTLTPPLSL